MQDFIVVTVLEQYEFHWNEDQIEIVESCGFGSEDLDGINRGLLNNLLWMAQFDKKWINDDREDKTATIDRSYKAIT